MVGQCNGTFFKGFSKTKKKKTFKIVFLLPFTSCRKVFVKMSAYELSYIFSMLNDLTQMINFPMQIPDCHSESPALLHLFFSSDANICSTMAFPPLANFDQVVVSFPLTFHQTQNGIPCFIT